MNRVDEKGKVFTPQVRKMEVEVNIFTVHGHVHGYVHLQPGQRIKDLLNTGSEQFLAITRATLNGQPVGGAAPGPTAVEVDFMALNKRHIVSVVPVGEDYLERRRDEEYYIPR